MNEIYTVLSSYVVHPCELSIAVLARAGLV